MVSAVRHAQLCVHMWYTLSYIFGGKTLVSLAVSNFML